MNYRSIVPFLIRSLMATKKIGYAPYVAIWVTVILAITYMIATGSIVESEAAQIAREVREILSLD